MPKSQFQPPENILSPEGFSAAQHKENAPSIARRRNVSLNKGGSVDLCTTTGGRVIAVVRYTDITEEIVKEITPLIKQAEEKAARPTPAASMPEGVSAPK